MNNFKEFGIEPQIKSFEGDKIPIRKILNKQIVVEDFKYSDSKFKDKGNGKLLTLQIIVDNTKRVVFTGSTNLIEMIGQVPKDKIPFTTIIVEENGRYEFT